ncbi:hypothetical protein LTR43_010495 [Exophiala xenobiotica]|nr:hypothetical protein LTR14_010098 [Exophiala xenobiotica]KAK5472186.1 hypothetical protein LTR55_010480 [Exophiala xenobiotica]
MSEPGFDKNGFPLNVPAAKREIFRICGRRGHITAQHEEQIRMTDEDLQEDYRQKASELREVYARYTKTVAEQLYSSRFRLIYELLQNGDDARYAENAKPTVTFRIKPTELTVETNEMGFSLRDVEAICATGKSSKIGNSDTTGEKGLGFKSVFGIADYVHIQSGLWSFRFEHKRGEDGVGMVTPIWTEVVPSLPAFGTKCTLRYADTRDSFYRRLISEFERLPKTTIFALRQVTRMVVVVECANGRSNQITFTKDGNLSSEQMQISTLVTGQFGDHGSEMTRLRLFKHTIIDLPSEEKQRTDATSDVTVAFEVTSSGTPLIPSRGQHIFAYLPVQRVPQLPFLIHANFVLAANREAVPDTDWNQALRRGVVTAFVDWVVGIVTHGDALEYTWMRYLPVKDSMEGFWGDLYDDIRDELLSKAILRSRRGRLHNLADLRILPHWFFYESSPLLPDTEADIYLSDGYGPDDVKTLKNIGLKPITSPEILTRMKLGISADASTPIHDRPLDDPWHTAFTALVQRLLQNGLVKREIQNLDIIPLSNNSWASISSLYWDPVYLPYVIDEDAVRIEVPDGLGLRKLHPMAVKDGERAGFYMSLGIASCPQNTVTLRILQAHKFGGRRGDILTYLSDLEILFWFGQPPPRLSIRHEDLWLVSNQNMQLQGCSLFFPSENEYHSEKLLAATPKEDFSDYGILDSRYMESQVRNHNRHDLNWLSWLQKCGVSYFPPLTKVRSRFYELNPLMVLIARDNSKSFVANLREHWSDYRVGASRITNDLKTISVPCRNESHKQLGETILPVRQLVEKSKELKMEEVLPFLELPPKSDIQQPDTWFFLKDFGVICELNASFFLMAIRLLSASTQTQLILVCTSIYAGIAQTANLGNTAAVQQMFSDQPLIRTHTPAEAWRRSTDCIWDGPTFLRAKNVLRPVYEADPNASHFFKIILSMRDVEYRDLIDELNMFVSGKNEASSSFEDELHGIYKLLAEMTSSESTIEAVRQEFNARGLIFVRQSWLKPSECLWNCTIAISGRVPLDQVYPKLKNFFVDKMQVMTMNINVLVQELAKTTKKTAPDFDEIKRIILAIGQLLAADPDVKIKDEFLTALKKKAFLPVYCPDGMRLFSIHQHFFINDHKRYGENFRHKARIVDFCHEEMTSLHPFFELLGIRHRYLSNQVRPVTTCHKPTESIALGRHIRDRAYGLSCCANAFNSPRYYNRNTATHQLLLNTDVYVCEEMWTDLTVRQEDQEISVRSDRAVVKVDNEVDGRLALYVPSDHDGLYSCFHTELPGELARLFAIQDRAALKVIYRILNDKDLDTTMKDEDLSYYEWFDRPESSQPSSPLNCPNGTEHSTLDLTSIRPTNPDEALLVVLADQSDNALYPHDQNTNYVPAPVSINYAAQDSAWEQVARNEQYKKLLREVVRQARRGPYSPRRGSLSLYEIDQALDELDNPVDYASFSRTFGGAGNGNFEHNARIGAAGELFVFELLKSFRVSDFSIDNWQSSIRHYVRELPEYANEPTWRGREISDIMYEGNCPRLMDILRQHTTFAYPPWLEAGVTTPAAVRYHIEVKTTSGPCSTPFFMSGNQYRLMRDKACDPQSPTAPTDIFVIMRVFNLFSSNIGLQVYINPWHLKDVALDFVADPWKVVPCEVYHSVREFQPSVKSIECDYQLTAHPRLTSEV